jgi:hypothetical protein
MKIQENLRILRDEICLKIGLTKDEGESLEMI